MKTKDEILAQTELPKDTVNIPEWGGDVIVSTLGAYDGDVMQRDWKKLGRPDGDFAGFRAWTVAHTVFDESNKRVFDPVADFDALNAHRGDIIQRLFDKACELNRLTKSDQEALVKN